MQNTTVLKKHLPLLRAFAVSMALAFTSLFLLSFTAKRLAGDFLKQLGITKTIADEKITNSLLGGSFDTYGIKNTKAIPAAVRATVAKEALLYAKQYINTPAFAKQYNQLKESHKPVFVPIKTPDEMQKENIELYKKSVSDAEKNLKKADAGMKPIFESVLVEVKKQQKLAEDPNSKHNANYRKNYDAAVKANQQNHDSQMAAWETKYPANHQQYIKPRLEQFVQETEGIDFAASTILKNGKQVFADPQYERKSNRWKMSFRAGKEVVETSRDFIQQWINEIN